MIILKDKFERAVSVVIMHEGGYVKNDADPGGATNYGVSLRYLRQLGYDLDGDGDTDADDVRGMTVDQAKAIYRKQWWDRYSYERLPFELAVKVFDLAVNMGPRRAHALLQRALHAAGHRHLVADGVLGPKTLAASNNAEPRIVLGALRVEAAYYYRKLVEKNPKLQTFLKGWENRALS